MPERRNGKALEQRGAWSLAPDAAWPRGPHRRCEAILRLAPQQPLQIVHVCQNEDDIPPRLGEDLKMLDALYPELRIDFLAVRGKFGPDLIDSLSRRIGVPKNQMFIGTPGDRFPHRIETLGSVAPDHRMRRGSENTTRRSASSDSTSHFIRAPEPAPLDAVADLVVTRRA